MNGLTHRLGVATILVMLPSYAFSSDYIFCQTFDIHVTPHV